MLNDVRFEADTTTDFDDRVHRWRAMNLDHDLVDELAWAAPRVKDKRLILSPQVEEVDNWQERISTMIQCVIRLPIHRFQMGHARQNCAATIIVDRGGLRDLA